MKKMTKGAIVTGLGVALLLGGGGTLAVWNDSAESTAGTIAAGNLDLRADKGVWEDSAGNTITDIDSYDVVPGETLTYAQDVIPTLDGDKLKAHLTVEGNLPAAGSEMITITDPVLTKKDGEVLSSPLTEADNNEPVTATTTFAFNLAAGDPGTEDHMNDEWDFSSIHYVLEQVNPNSTPDN